MKRARPQEGNHRKVSHELLCISCDAKVAAMLHKSMCFKAAGGKWDPALKIINCLKITRKVLLVVSQHHWCVHADTEYLHSKTSAWSHLPIPRALRSSLTAAFPKVTALEARVPLWIRYPAGSPLRDCRLERLQPQPYLALKRSFW